MPVLSQLYPHVRLGKSFVTAPSLKAMPRLLVKALVFMGMGLPTTKESDVDIRKSVIVFDIVKGGYCE
jgi:hypothetical protein